MFWCVISIHVTHRCKLLIQAHQLQKQLRSFLFSDYTFLCPALLFQQVDVTAISKLECMPPELKLAILESALCIELLIGADEFYEHIQSASSGPKQGNASLMTSTLNDPSKNGQKFFQQLDT